MVYRSIRMQVLLVVTGLTLLSIGISGQAKNWTVLVFLNGDNNLERAGIRDVNEMELTIDTTLYNVVVQFDRHPSYDTTNGDWTTTRRYLITRDTLFPHIGSVLLEDLGERNMGDPNELAEFVSWGADSFPANHYWVIAWDHGSGWYDRGPPIRGFSNDETDDDEIGIANGEYNFALMGIKSHIGQNIDLWGFDACLMGMLEVEYESKDYVDILVHSEHTEPGYGYPYYEILDWLSQHPNATPRELGSAAGSLYVQSYQPGGSQYVDNMSSTQSVVDLDPSFTRLSLKIDDFARELIKVGGKTHPDVGSARFFAQEYPYPDSLVPTHVDLYDFADWVDFLDIGGVGSPLDNASQAVKDALGYPPVIPDRPLLHEGHYTAPYGWNVDYSYGIAIYYPAGTPDTTYTNLYLAWNNTWWPFINGATSLPSDLLLTYDSHTGSDTVQAGSTVSTYITLRNSSDTTATQVEASIQAPLDPYVTILTPNPISYPDIPSEGIGQSASAYSFDVAASTPDGHRIALMLEISAEGGTYDNWASFNLIVRGVPGVEEMPFVGHLVGEPRNLSQNKPNPFTKLTTIEFVLSAPAHTALSIYDASGRFVRRLVGGQRPAGRQRVEWDGRDARGRVVSRGVYFYRLEAGNFASTKKMVVLR